MFMFFILFTYSNGDILRCVLYSIYSCGPPIPLGNPEYCLNLKRKLGLCAVADIWNGFERINPVPLGADPPFILPPK